MSDLPFFLRRLDDLGTATIPQRDSTAGAAVFFD